MDEPPHVVHDLEQVLDRARGSGEAWTEFMRLGMFSAGLYRLTAGEADTQDPHAEDEIYYVLAGRAVLEVDGERHPVESGSIAFVAKRVEHRFVDITEDLELLVIFAPPETDP